MSTNDQHLNGLYFNTVISTFHSSQVSVAVTNVDCWRCRYCSFCSESHTICYSCQQV